MMQSSSYQRMGPGNNGNGNGPGNNGDQYTSSHYWRQQQELSQLSRQTNTTHNYARCAAMSSRTSARNNVMTVLELAMQFVQQQQQQEMISAPTNMTIAAGSTPVKGSAKVTNGTGVMLNPKQKKEMEREEELRRINEDINKQYWTAIDLSGQGLMCVTPKVFNYNFLQKLYLSHNKLVEIPSCITKLTQLKVLDLSDNQLSTLPGELGLMFSLKYLFLFDNKLNSLPFEFGYLFQLEVLGIDGNPLPENVKDVMAKEGTRGVIIGLREKAPVKQPSPPREWLTFDEPTTDEKFTVLTYNTLCDKYATAQMYGYTPSWALSWDYRSKLLMGQILGHEPDIVCLQEVDGTSYENFWTPELAKRGYKGLHWQKTRARTMGENESKKVDGCATFYKDSKFKLVERFTIEYSSQALRKDDFKKTADIYNRVMNKDEIALICVFEDVASGDLLVCSNTHIHWNPVFKDVKLVQSALLLEELQRVCSKYASKDGEGARYPKYTDVKQIPMVLCCDLNSTIDSGACQLFSQGKVSGTHSDLEGRVYGKYTETGMEHPFQIKSAYADINELPFTNYTPNFVDAIDYIYISSQNLGVTGLLGELDQDYAHNYVGFPNVHHPSDHIPLMTQLGFKKIKEVSTKSLPPPNFGNKK